MLGRGACRSGGAVWSGGFLCEPGRLYCMLAWECGAYLFEAASPEQCWSGGPWPDVARRAAAEAGLVPN